MSPRACMVLQTLLVCVTLPTVIPVKLPLTFLFSVTRSIQVRFLTVVEKEAEETIMKNTGIESIHTNDFSNTKA